MLQIFHPINFDVLRNKTNSADGLKTRDEKPKTQLTTTTTTTTERKDNRLILYMRITTKSD